MNRWTLPFLVLSACAVTLNAQEETTVEVKSGTVVVKSSAGETSAQAGETVVVDGQKMVRKSSPNLKSHSYSRLTINGKTIEVSTDGGSVSMANQNGQVTIRCGALKLTGDTVNLAVGDKTYDISASNKVSITVRGDHVEVDTGGGNMVTPGKMEPAAILIINIDQQGQHRIGADPVTLEQLRAKLKEAALADPSQRVFVNADHRAKHTNVAEILEMCRRAGLKNIGIGSRTVKDKAPEF